MKIMTVLGTRPEIIRLSRVIELLDSNAEHVMVHTGQNFEDSLDGVFFRELHVRPPDLNLGVRASSFAEQAAQILVGAERAMVDHKPDRVLILGDTNSGLSAIVARRLGIPVYHMEAGNRCFDDRVPEELNRRIIDHSSSVLLPYTENARRNLLREGIEPNRIFVTGNPINEVIDHYRGEIAQRDPWEGLGLSKRGYVLATIHRAENVDIDARLRSLITSLAEVHRASGLPVICSLHPRTRSRIDQFMIDIDYDGVRFVEPMGFFDFVALEQSAACLVTDSGTVQEEGCILGVPTVTVRDATERPETIDCGSNCLTGVESVDVVRAVKAATSGPVTWVPPTEYLARNVARTVVSIVVGYHAAERAERGGAPSTRLSTSSQN